MLSRSRFGKQSFAPRTMWLARGVFGWAVVTSLHAYRHVLIMKTRPVPRLGGLEGGAMKTAEVLCTKSPRARSWPRCRLRRTDQAENRDHGAGHGGRRRDHGDGWARRLGLLLARRSSVRLWWRQEPAPSISFSNATAMGSCDEPRIAHCLPAGFSRSKSEYLEQRLVWSASFIWLAPAREWLRRLPREPSSLTCFLYTPLKRVSTLNTLIGAVPGAMPPVIGWVSVRGSFDGEIVILFLILFLWQVPHFLAIAWIYKQDYARAGLCMLPVVDESGSITGRQMICYCLALLSASLLPLSNGRAGLLYLAGAIFLGGVFLACAIAFARRPGLDRARSVLRASLVYLPLLLALLLLDGSPH